MGLNFSVLISESIFGYPFWRCKRGPRCTKWRIEFGPHFGWSVKNERMRISRAKLFGLKIREHIWIPILEMQAWPHVHKVMNWFRDSFRTIHKKRIDADVGVEIFIFEIREHIWISLLEMQVCPRMNKVTNWFWDSFRTIFESRTKADIGGWTFQFWNSRAYLDTHFGDASVAPHAQSDKLISGLISDDPRKTNRRR